MRVLLSTIGSRGDVQPLMGLAVELRAHGHEARFVTPPDFKDWIEGLGFHVTPIGPELRKMTAARPALPASPLTPEQRRQLAEASVAAQFETVSTAAQGCDAIVAATALQIAAASVAEKLGIAYVFAAYSPNVLPSPRHAPPPLPPIPGVTPPSTTDNRELWALDAERFRALFGPALNAHRATIGMPAVTDVRSYVFGPQPWLAADQTLGPWPESGDATVFQPGAWILPDERPLSPELESFLDAGEPPIYFGFGSGRATPGVSDEMITAARALGRRAILSRGWADLSIAGNAPDCLSIDEVNQQQLFTRVAAVVHHGGAGTTATAAMAAAPQVVVPQVYDQHYWAHRVQQLGIGIAHAPGAATADSLTAALTSSLRPDIATRARSVAASMRRDGARVAAERLVRYA
jgi:vancomycin aglycone glucosyltransferase